VSYSSSLTRVIDLSPDSAAPRLNRDRLCDCFFVTWMHWRQLFHFQNVDAEVADLTQAQSMELIDCLADSAKHILKRGKRVASADCLE
jgi:hypothetical protein